MLLTAHLSSAFPRRISKKISLLFLDMGRERLPGLLFSPLSMAGEIGSDWDGLSSKVFLGRACRGQKWSCMAATAATREAAFSLAKRWEAKSAECKPCWADRALAES